MDTIFGKAYVCIKTIGVIAILVWALMTCCSFMPIPFPFTPFAPADLMPHPHLPQPDAPPTSCTVNK